MRHFMTVKTWIVLFVVVFVCLPEASCADAKTKADKALLKKIKNLISPFPTLKMVQDMTDLICKLGYNGTTMAQAASTNPEIFMNMALNILNNKQKAQVVQLVSNLQKEFGTVATGSLTDLVDVARPLGVLILDPISKKMAKQIKKGQGKKKVCGNAITSITDMITKDLIQALVDTSKRSFTASQCQSFFKYMAPTYLSLGKYSFNNPPCSGKGICV